MKPQEIFWNRSHVATQVLDQDGRITETVVRDAAGYTAWQANRQQQMASLSAAAGRFQNRSR